MQSWTPPVIVGISRHEADISLFERLGMAYNVKALPNQWTLSRTELSHSPLVLSHPEGLRLGIDFTAGKARHRSRESGSGAQALSRALGLKAWRKTQSGPPHIIDATGGLGQDAWALASIDCQLTLMERHPIVHALLDDALIRARAEPATQTTAQQITLIEGDAVQLIQRHAQAPTHAIYLDPMYPPRHRTAASKKGMQILHALLGPVPASESPDLLLNSLACPVSRVAVKRPKGAPGLSGTQHFQGQKTQIDTPNTRYDIYHLPALRTPKNPS